MDETLGDRLAIRDVVGSWVIARDCADWEWLRPQGHDDGYTMATWFQGSKEDFIKVSQTRMTILQPGPGARRAARRRPHGTVL